MNVAPEYLRRLHDENAQLRRERAIVLLALGALCVAVGILR